MALSEAQNLAQQLAEFPQLCLRSDRRSSYEQWGMSFEDALRNETVLGRETIESGETAAKEQPDSRRELAGTGISLTSKLLS